MIQVTAKGLTIKRSLIFIGAPFLVIAVLFYVFHEPSIVSDTLPVRLAEIAKSQEAQRIVVGLPLRLDGTHGPEAAAARRLASGLRQVSGLPVELVDERLTTAAAERSLIAGGVRREKRRLSVDRVAATLLLQGHLDAGRAQGALKQVDAG